MWINSNFVCESFPSFSTCGPNRTLLIWRTRLSRPRPCAARKPSSLRRCTETKPRSLRRRTPCTSHFARFFHVFNVSMYLNWVLINSSSSFFSNSASSRRTTRLILTGCHGPLPRLKTPWRSTDPYGRWWGNYTAKKNTKVRSDYLWTCKWCVMFAAASNT